MPVPKSGKILQPYIPHYGRKPNPNFHYDETKISQLIKDINPITVGKDEAPIFENSDLLLNWVVKEFDNNRNITIKSDNEKILLSKNSAKRASRKQDPKNIEMNSVFLKIKETLENAKYYDFEPLDKQHEKDAYKKLGQYVYFSKIIIGNTPYRVRFKIDVPKYNDSDLVYAGHRLQKI